MKFSPIRAAMVTAIWAAGSTVAMAADGPDVTFSGFGTLGYTTTNSDAVQFRSTIRQHKGATESNGDFGVDSKLGLQANVKFNETFSAVGQVLAMRRDGEENPTVEWLFGQAKVADWADLRVGRMVLPTFMLSDSRNVGYASHWLRAPQETYGFFFPTSFDGVQGVLRGAVGGFNLTTQLSAGTSKSDAYFFGPVGQADYKKIYSVNMLAEQGNWTFRLGYTAGADTEVTSSSQNEKGKDKFSGLGVQYDNGDLLVMSEYVTRRWTSKVNSALDGVFDSDGYYVSAGYRFGSFMPYVTYSRYEPKGLAFTLQPGYPNDGETQAIGLRWDAMKNVAVKAQVEEVKGTQGTQLLGVAGQTYNGEKVRAVSIAVDFVF